MWDLGSWTQDQTRVPYIGRELLNPWTTRKSLKLLILMKPRLFTSFMDCVFGGGVCEQSSPYPRSVSFSCMLSSKNFIALYFILWLLFSPSVISNSLRPHGPQHARLLCPSLSLGACSNSCPLSQWCHPTVSSSVIPFSSCLQSFPASGSFLMSQLFSSGGQSIGTSASASVLLMNI